MKVNPIPTKDVPLTSDSFLVTLAFPGSFPMTVIWSWSVAAPYFMSTDGVVCVVDGCGRGYEAHASCSCLI
jgi:hypothetical protein